MTPGITAMFRLVTSYLLVCVCGGSIKEELKLDGRIVGGHVIDIKNAPYQAALQEGDSLFCGASIISKYYVLTAAQCSHGRSAEDISVRVGSSFRDSDGSLHQAAQIIYHGHYTTSPAVDFDVSLVKVSTPFEFTASVKPVLLATEAPDVGSSAVTSGWGSVVAGGNLPTELFQAQVSIVSHGECNKAYSTTITSTMLCAGVLGAGKGPCRADTGGPLVVGDHLVGIVSFSHGCADWGYPGVYTNVAAFRDWITQHSGV